MARSAGPAHVVDECLHGREVALDVNEDRAVGLVRHAAHHAASPGRLRYPCPVVYSLDTPVRETVPVHELAHGPARPNVSKSLPPSDPKWVHSSRRGRDLLRVLVPRWYMNRIAKLRNLTRKRAERPSPAWYFMSQSALGRSGRPPYVRGSASSRPPGKGACSGSDPARASSRPNPLSPVSHAHSRRCRVLPGLRCSPEARGGPSEPDPRRPLDPYDVPSMRASDGTRLPSSGRLAGEPCPRRPCPGGARVLSAPGTRSVDRSGKR